MCGIVGYVGNKQVVPLIIQGLRKLEYRGYDSAGIAVVDDNHHLELRRADVKLRNLEEAIRLNPLDGNYGIGHTRWATHGRPTEEYAHPHRDCSGRIVVVHNGIIENYLTLKEMLRSQGHDFKTETDTEIVAHLIEEIMKSDGLGFEEAVRKAVQQLRGIFALSIINADEPDKIISVREGPPVVIGLGDGEFFVASDIPAILQHTRDVFYLGEKEIPNSALRSRSKACDRRRSHRLFIPSPVRNDPDDAQKEGDLNMLVRLHASPAQPFLHLTRRKG